MTSTAPARTRLAWAQLPAHVQQAVVEQVGAEVVEATSHEGGYSPGMAATLRTAAGERVFVKAVSSGFHERSAELYRDEARVNGLLPDGVPAPRMRWVVDDGEWVAMGFDAADSSLEVPWRPDDLAAALELFTAMAAVPAPAGLGSAADFFGGMPSWADAAREGADLGSWDPWVAEHLDLLVELSIDWAQASVGDRLGHCDARADNMVRLGDRVLLTDWPYAAAAAPWVDLLCFLPSAELEGAGRAAEIWASHPLGRAADQARATALLAGITGFFVHGSVQPPPPGIPHLRAYQRAQGEVALAWLRQRLADGLAGPV